MKAYEFIACIVIGFGVAIALDYSAAERQNQRLSDLTGESIESLQQKLKDCEERGNVDCELKLIVEVNKNE